MDQCCSLPTISMLPFKLCLAACETVAAGLVLLCCDTTLHDLAPSDTILFWLWAMTHLLSRTTVPHLICPADVHLSGRLAVSCASWCSRGSTWHFLSLEGSFWAQNDCIFCASAAHWWQSPAYRPLPVSCDRGHLIRAGAGVPFSCNLISTEKCLCWKLVFASVR